MNPLPKSAGGIAAVVAVVSALGTVLQVPFIHDLITGFLTAHPQWAAATAGLAVLVAALSHSLTGLGINPDDPRVPSSLKVLVLAVGLSMVVTACGPKADVILLGSGGSLKTLADQFVGVGTMYKNGCDAGTLTKQQCTNWRVFAVRFKDAYPLAVQAWEAARDARDVAGQKNADALATTLATDLANLAGVALKTYGVQPGK